MTLQKAAILAILVISVINISNLQAQTTRLYHYQGTLNGADGEPYNGIAQIEFRIFPTPRSDTPEWAEVHEGVSVTDGQYHVLLGSAEPLKLSFHEYYLEVQSDVGETAQPRTMIVGSGYNFRLWFLFAAYTIVWLAIFAYTLSIARRQKRISSELQALYGQVSTAQGLR